MLTRRHFLTGTATLASGAAVLRQMTGSALAQRPGADAPRAESSAATGQPAAGQKAWPPSQPGVDYLPVTTPNGSTLPWKLVDDVKVFHLIAEEVEHEIAPGLKAKCWGYNGQVHGPTIEAMDGDRVRFYVTNRLPAATTVHWHGILIPNGMDGVGGLNQKAIAPGETFKYEFTLNQAGTGMYHAHHDEMTQIALGMTGIFVIHPRPGKSDREGQELAPRVDRDFALMLHEWRIDPGTSRPNPNEMTEFNVLTINARAYPGTAPLVVKKGEKVRIRIGNLSPMDHHPIHLHGYQFTVTESDGGRYPKSSQHPDTTVFVPTGATRTIEFVADEPGDWAMHCHMTHHVMNQMGHGFPNMIGVNPGKMDENIRKNLRLAGYMTMGQSGMAEMGDMGMKVPPNSIPMVGGEGPLDYITMGGMFTILKVRDELPRGYDTDPGWYKHPEGTLAMLAKAEDLHRDGIDVSAAMGVKPIAPGMQHGADKSSASAAKSGKAQYTCPMHPEVVENHPGDCPKCGMTLVAKK